MAGKPSLEPIPKIAPCHSERSEESEESSRSTLYQIPRYARNDTVRVENIFRIGSQGFKITNRFVPMMFPLLSERL